MNKYLLLFNGRSAEFTDLQKALHTAYLWADVFDVYIVEYIAGNATERDELIGITTMNRREN